MTVEEKARRYDEALSKAMDVYTYYCDDREQLKKIESIFPELKKSEDELTWLTNYIAEETYYLSMDIRDNEDRIKLQKLQKSLAWLEKQGEKQETQYYCDKEELMHCLGKMVAYWADRHGCSVYEENDLMDYIKIRMDAVIHLFNPNACLVDLSDCSDEYRNAYYDGYNKCNREWLKKRGEKPQGKKKLEYTLDDVFDDLRAGLDPSPIQNTQKSAIEAKPKFNVGQWVVWQNKCYKVNYNGCGYELVDQNGLSTSLEYGTIDGNAHIWNIIKDAKDGDVLASKDSSCVLIFRSRHTSTSTSTFSSYYNTSNDDNDDWSNDCFLPATKEQRELLFAKMRENGCKWDVAKKKRVTL